MARVRMSAPALPEHVAAFCAAFPPGGRCWIAFSGGLDSTVLLDAATRVRERLPGPLRAIHIDHGLQDVSGQWRTHCERQCAQRAVPCLSHSLHLHPEPGQSLEALAREARYRVFREHLAPGDLLLCAHHQDDQAETLLLALLRGSGVEGLAAMPASAPLGAGRLVRPLLGLPRSLLRAYAETQGLSWIEDPSNDALVHDRNLLRHRILPELRRRWPAVSATLARSAAHCAEAAELIGRQAAELLPEVQGRFPGTLSIPGVQAHPRAVQKSLLRFWLRQRGFLMPDAARLERILDEVLDARADGAPLVSWSGCEVRRYRRELFALAPLPSSPAGQVLRWESLGEPLQLPAGLGRLVWEAPLPELAGEVVSVRFDGDGSGCRPSGSAHHRTLKKIFQEAGIPGWLRNHVPRVYLGEHLVAVAGVCRCELPGGGANGVSVRWLGHPWQDPGLFR